MSNEPKTTEHFKARHAEIMENARSAETLEEREYWLGLGDAAAEDLAIMMDPSGEWKMALLAVALVAFVIAAVWLLSWVW